jgi:hypothetical protein
MLFVPYYNRIVSTPLTREAVEATILSKYLNSPIDASAVMTDPNECALGFAQREAFQIKVPYSEFRLSTVIKGQVSSEGNKTFIRLSAFPGPLETASLICGWCFAMIPGLICLIISTGDLSTRGLGLALVAAALFMQFASASALNERVTSLINDLNGTERKEDGR